MTSVAAHAGCLLLEEHCVSILQIGFGAKLVLAFMNSRTRKAASQSRGLTLHFAIVQDCP